MFRNRYSLLIGLFASLPAVALAQSQTLGVSPLQYVVSPEMPGPNQTVTIEVQGVGSFLGDATIVWEENGKTAQQGVGDQDFSFTTGGLGSQAEIDVAINSPSEGTFTKDFVFTPSIVDLVWEADTTVPPLYHGKALYSAGSELKVVAFPTVITNGAEISPNSLSYQWTVDSVPAPQESGLGRSSVTFQGNSLQSSEDVSVDVYSGGTEVGSSEIVIPAQPPQLVFYDDDPLRGILWDEALPASISLTSSDFTIAAVPYFFSSASARNGALTYDWTLNGEETSGPDSAQGILTLQQSGSGTGAVVLSASVQSNDTDTLVQGAQAALQVVFGTSNTGTSLFGL